MPCLHYIVMTLPEVAATSLGSLGLHRYCSGAASAASDRACRRAQGYQLSMTRALGHDLLAHCGVLPTPAVAGLRALPAPAACLILASDGVWDALSPDEAVRFVMGAIQQVDHRACLKCGVSDMPWRTRMWPPESFGNAI